MKFFLLIGCFLIGMNHLSAQKLGRIPFLAGLERPPYPKNVIEVGATLQLGSYQGDLNPSNFTFVSSDPGLGIFLKRNPIMLLPSNAFRRSRTVKRVFNTEAFLTYQNLSFKDQYLLDLHRVNSFCYSNNLRRNLSFSTSLFQFGVNLEYNPFIFGNQNYFAPYLVSGVSGIYFNPKATYTLDGVTKTVALKNIQTEGVDYYNITSAYNVGIGVKFVSEKGFTVGIQIAQNFTQTDYLDDVSRFYPIDFSTLTPEQILLSARGIELNPDFIASGFSSNWIRNNPDIIRKYLGRRRGDSYDNDAFWNLKISYARILKLKG